MNRYSSFRKYASKLRVTDAVCISYCILMIIIISIFGCKLSDQFYIIKVYLGCILASIIFILLRKFDGRVLGFFTSFYPLILLIPFYEISGHQVHLFFDGFYDHYILMIENAIFPVHPTIWFEQFYHPVLSEWMMFGYSFYLLLLPITISWLYFTNKDSESKHLLLSLMISFFICYVIFSLFPALGPRIAMADQYTVEIKGYFFKTITNLLETNAMLHGGAFPSAHCSAATVMFVLSYKYDKRLFYWILPVIFTLYISTVYGRYHYPLDVLAGIIIGIGSIKLSYPVRRFWERIASSRR